MFSDFLYNLRDQKLSIGIGEWLTFLGALRKGLATDLDGMYHLGRSLLCRSETEFDQYDVAFAVTFAGAALPEELREELAQWLERVWQAEPGEVVDWGGVDPEELMRRFEETLRQQRGEHHGGNRWVGTGGTSPYGHSGRARHGIRVGGEGGGGRSAVRTAMERRWENYRGDRTLDVRDLKMALRALRSLAREGEYELDLDETIEKTARNAGDIEIIEHRARRNRLKVVLLMDAGGSMTPHVDEVEKLFSAAKQMKTFKTFRHLFFHNCVYQYLYDDFEQMQRVSTHEVLARLTPQHRLLFVGDASMAPYELFTTFSWPDDRALAGADWLRRFKERCPASVWLNPDPQDYWRHPTVSAIGRIFPMYPLTLGGLRDGVKKLRAPI
ncbi:MAG: VWA domain-containing protein [Deltaproteobacteria bacterium]|nr:VWA domain-containing protein [Deltaproteobacteria bacterium]MBW2258156.1 VWA domain-containing protein [Deltaproteobacteria bacterium]